MSPLRDPSGSTDLLAAIPAEALARTARLVSGALDVPVVLIASLTDGRLVVRGGLGLPESLQRGVSLPEAGSLGPGTTCVPVLDDAGRVLGALCVADAAPREWAAAELAQLADFAASIAAEAALAALRASEGRYRILFDQNPLPMGIYDVETMRVLDVNQAAVAQYGWSREEFRAMTLRDLYPDGDAATLERAVASVAASEGSWHQRTRHRHRRRDGSLLWVDALGHALSASGRPARLVLAHDVTEQVAAEEALRASESRFRAFVEQSSDGLFVCGPDAVFRYVSPAFSRILGCSPEAMVGHTIGEYVHPDDVGKALSTLAQMTEERGAPHRVEVLARHGDGPWRALEAVGCVLDEARGSDSEVLVSVRDTTDRRRTEEALRASEERFRSLSASSPLGIFEADLEGEITYVNPRAEQLWERPGDTMLARGWLDRVHPEDRAPLFESWTAALAWGETFQREYRLLLDEGRVRWIHAWSAFVCGADGAHVGVVGTVEDVTERRELEEQLRQAQRMEAVGQLAGGIAHDFNNLLTVIKAHAEFLLDAVPPEDGAREDVEEIARAASRAAALTRQLLAFSRKQLLRPQALDLNAVLTGIEPMLRRLIGEDVALRMLPAYLPATVRADPGQLEQVIVNLALNARDAMPSGGTLTVDLGFSVLEAPLAHEHGVVQSGRYVLLRVRDTGVGMSEAVRRRVFEPFFTTKGVGKGTGLGLSTVYGIVRQSGGHVTIDSTEGRGSTFTVYLPEVAQAEAPDGEEGTAAAGGSGTVLLVEDEAAVRSLARRILERRGYTVLEARDGRHAIELAARHEGSIDLLLTDVVMPEMNGRELAETVTDLRPGMRVVYMSGYTDDVIVGRGALSPRHVLLHKPFTSQELTRAVGAALAP